MINLPGRMTLHRVFCSVLSIVVLGTSCSGNEMVESDTLYYLDTNKTSIVQRIEPEDKVDEGCKFVQVEVTKVVNPKRYSLTFEVRYQLNGGESIYLGSFSPYPADNPGKFIVPTQGKVKNQGAIILSLVMQDKPDPKDTIQVAVKRIKFLKE
jgi:hypothetical protein